MREYRTFIGLDLGDRFSQAYIMDDAGRVIKEERLRMVPDALEKLFSGIGPAKIALETGTHSPWVSRLLETLGHRVYVANARKLRMISSNPRKNDRLDAQMLARLVRFDPQLLSPIRHRSRQSQADLAVLQARDALVQARTALINTVRGLMKSIGARACTCSAESFHKRVHETMPIELKPALDGLVDTIRDLTGRIREYDSTLEALCESYPVTEQMREIPGVGPVTALAFTLVIDDRTRFTKSRQVGAYLGLVPRRDQSGDSDPQLRITKAGNGLVRRLLVNAAHYILGPFAPPSDLRDWGLKRAGTGSKAAKKKAVVGVARKLAVLMHRLWVTGECYQPCAYERAA